MATSRGWRARAFACFDGESWADLGRCFVGFEAPDVIATRAKGGAPLFRATSLRPPLLDDSVTDVDGKPSYVVIWIERRRLQWPAAGTESAAGEPDHIVEATLELPVALRFEEGREASRLVGLVQSAAAAKPRDTERESTPGTAASDARSGLTRPPRVLGVFSAELLCPTELGVHARPGSPASRAVAAAAPFRGVEGKDEGGWVSRGLGSVQLLVSSESRSGHLVMTGPSGQTLLRHELAPFFGVALANSDGSLRTEEQADSRVTMTTKALRLEAYDARLADPETLDGPTPFCLRFESPMEVARFRMLYARMQGKSLSTEQARADADARASSSRPSSSSARAGTDSELLESEDAVFFAFLDLVSSHPFSLARALSTDERRQRGMAASQLTYGELEFRSLRELFQILRDGGHLSRIGGKFVDLGSGVGKAVFGAAMLYPFEEVVGIEILASLHEAALQILDRFDREVRLHLADERQRRVRVHLMRDDFLRVPWLDADVILVTSTCFESAVMSRIAALSNDMRVGTLCITLTTRLPSARWEVVHRGALRVAWGEVTVFVHRKQVA